MISDLNKDNDHPERKNGNAPTDKQQVEARRLLVNRKISQEREGIRNYKDETTSNSSKSWIQIMQTLNSWLSQNPNIVVTIR